MPLVLTCRPAGPRFFISADATTPEIVMTATLSGVPLNPAGPVPTYEWSATLVFDGGVPPTNTAYGGNRRTQHAPIRSQAGHGNTWRIPFTEVRGGLLTVNVIARVGGTVLNASSTNLTIAGTNPLPTAIRAFANSIGATKVRFRKQLRQRARFSSSGHLETGQNTAAMGSGAWGWRRSPDLLPQQTKPGTGRKTFALDGRFIRKRSASLVPILLTPNAVSPLEISSVHGIGRGLPKICRKHKSHCRPSRMNSSNSIRFADSTATPTACMSFGHERRAVNWLSPWIRAASAEVRNGKECPWMKGAALETLAMLNMLMRLRISDCHDSAKKPLTNL
ncbi:hypothetical protein AVKW3434_13105 [Acidovorax sp. SUPP3434]|uniref:hypothetical protein n=1 Tax=Acidovorax sp. SUPP3434 TaxID=2920880 RepID=UPI0023DE2938|nr:hypothetical protein [Acidovorax sp. SUPP3434]GKT00332.1 hypothetical protein AVKW3434_13105 [Acidovorax sp. SUPP3434]